MQEFFSAMLEQSEYVLFFSKLKGPISKHPVHSRDGFFGGLYIVLLTTLICSLIGYQFTRRLQSGGYLGIKYAMSIICVARTKAAKLSVLRQ